MKIWEENKMFSVHQAFQPTAVQTQQILQPQNNWLLKLITAITYTILSTT
jgi:hypothetical protein